MLVTLRQHKGSSPRESGARMIVSQEAVRGSIGGGNLEHQAISTARDMLNQAGTVNAPRLEPYGLGPHLNQCCGGAVELLFEAIPSPAPAWLEKLSGALLQGDHAVLASAVTGEAQQHFVTLPVGRQSELPGGLQAVVRELLDAESPTPMRNLTVAGQEWWLERISGDRRRVWLFGAGHVGKAVVKSLADLPFSIRWMDARANEFPATVPANVTIANCPDLPGEVADAPSDTIFIVMTHSHELDEEICHAVLSRGKCAFLGMIGSVSKRRRFVHRLEKRGIDPALLERFVCPIGLPAIAGKEPATIALSLAAQLMSRDKE